MNDNFIGMNPLECKKQIEKLSKEAGLPNLPIVAAVLGDDIFSSFKDHDANNDFKCFEVEGELDCVPKNRKIISANAYLGAVPIVRALEQGAQVIVTGRCTDSALVLAPLMHEFKWQPTQYDLLAQGSVAGHIIECGCQATGGNFTDWKQSEENGWDNVGFPIVDCFPDGSFILSKPEGTGGVVNRNTVLEQLLYEIGDPSSYILPDVIVDFRQVVLTELEPTAKGTGRVLVKGAKGRAPTPYFKTSITYFDGFRLSASLLMAGADAARKGYAVAHAILTKTRRMLQVRKLSDFEAINIEAVGADSCKYNIVFVH